MLFSEGSVAVITSVSGEVSVFRVQDTVVHQVATLDNLFDGDSLQIISGEVTLLFNTGKIISLKDSSSLYITAETDSVRGMSGDAGLSEDVRFSLSPLFEVGKGEEKVVPKFVLRAPEDSMVPILTIYVPGNTSLSTARPDVIWSQYPGANWYAVRFQLKGDVLIDNATTDTVMAYTEQNEDLEPGTYLIRVSAFHNKDTLNSQQCFVRVIDSNEVATVKEKISILDHIQADEYTKKLLKALVYEDHKLLIRAAEYYEALGMMRPDDPYSYKALASLYGRLGLPETANHYVDRYEAVKTEDR
jgi:hypothetical protein